MDVTVAVVGCAGLTCLFLTSAVVLVIVMVRRSGKA
jgi:hypothetical protein